MDNNFMKLRTTAFGGFNKQDVIAYIEKVKNDSYEENNRLQRQMKELNEKIDELEAQAASFGDEKDKLVKRISELSVNVEGKNETVEEINEATNHLKNVADELCESLRDFMQRISENCCSVVIEGTEKHSDDEFDGERFIAELEAEIYAKLGVEEADDEASEVDLASCEEPDEKKTDRVSSILSSVSAFSSYEAEAEPVKDTTVSDILGALSFLK